MDPVWTLLYRRVFSQVAYWMSTLGFNWHDRSLINRIYFVYFCLFWFIWIVAVFALIGATIAGMFSSLGVVALPQLVVTLYVYILVVWILFQLWRVTGRSPFVFSEEDAYLLCQTPINRRKIGLAWFLHSWLETILPFAVGSIILSFTLVEWQFQHGLNASKIIPYFYGSGRALIIVLPLQMALQACLWGIGTFRLRGYTRPGNRSPFWLRFAAPGLGLILLASFFIPGLHDPMLYPLSFPLQAAFMDGIPTAAWLGRFSLELFYLVLGFLLLVIGTNKINVGQAAEETKLYAAIQLARSGWNFNLADTMLLRKRLVATPSPSRLQAYSGPWVLVWKDAVQSLRFVRLRQVANWVLVLGLSLGMFTASNWAQQIVIGGIWTLALGNLGTQRLRNDLAHWWLLRSLPTRAINLLSAEFGLSWGGGVLLGWLALAFSNMAVIPCLVAGTLLPFLAAASILGTAHDILNQSKVRVLMSPSIAEENVPRQNIEGVFWALVSVLIPFGMFSWFFTHPGQVLWGIATLPVALSITLLNVRATLSTYRWIN